MSNMRSAVFYPVFLVLFLNLNPLYPFGGIWKDNAAEMQDIRNATVKITTVSYNYSYSDPWLNPELQRSSGTGFVISGSRILTNAHVVSSANTIRVARPVHRRDYTAKVVHIAHDADLAILEVDEPGFFEGTVPLTVGDVPELNSPVTVVGYPMGGERISITRGVVSRIDMDVYAHSQIDSHLVIQVDAAINPGNSGGPAIQDSKVIGVAFQGLSRGENLGYLIPPPVIKKFLSDIRDGRYDGYIELGVAHFPTENPVLKKALGISSDFGDDSGVYIYSVLPGSSAYGHIQEGDVLLRLQDHPISGSGDVEADGQLVSYSELTDNLGTGELITAEVMRNGKILKLSFPAAITKVISFMRRNYDNPPPYYITGGFVFQPLDADLYGTYGRTWAQQEKSMLLYRYNYFISRKLWNEARQDVVLTRRLADPVNMHSGDFVYSVVGTVNGQPVKDFSDFAEKLDISRNREPFTVIRFRNEPVPLVLRNEDLREADPKIFRKYGIMSDRRLQPESK